MFKQKKFAMSVFIFITVFLIYSVSTDQQQRSQNKPMKPTVSQTPQQPQLNFIPKNDVSTKYVPNEPQLNTTGYCKITVDNKQNSFPVIVRIWSLTNHKPVRTFTIKQGEQFTAQNMTPDNYEIRYMHLYQNAESQDVFKTDPFLLNQTPTENGTNYDTISFTLYKVHNGNAKTHPISATEL